MLVLLATPDTTHAKCCLFPSVNNSGDLDLEGTSQFFWGRELGLWVSVLGCLWFSSCLLKEFDISASCPSSWTQGDVWDSRTWENLFICYFIEEQAWKGNERDNLHHQWIRLSGEIAHLCHGESLPRPPPGEWPAFISYFWTNPGVEQMLSESWCHARI